MDISRLIANRFCIEDPKRDLLGRGGVGDVYRAIDTRTGETGEVKALNPEVLGCDQSLLERFVREGEALRRLNHPNIVHMIPAVEEQGQHYPVMESVEGDSLPVNEVARIFPDVVDALTRAHHLGIIHRHSKRAAS